MKTENLEALRELWLRNIDAHPATIATYDRAIRPFFAWLSEHEVTEPSREDVLRFREDIASRLQPATVTSISMQSGCFSHGQNPKGTALTLRPA